MHQNAGSFESVRNLRAPLRRVVFDGEMTIEIERRAGVALVRLQRPEKRNALNLAMARALNQSLDELAGSSALVITGDERAFSAGADLTESSGGEPLDTGWLAVTRKLAAVEIPTIAAIEGWCLGGGLELALACDLRVASVNAVFGTPEVTRGLLPGNGGTQRIPRLIGAARAKEMMFLGERLSAEQAQRWGLVNRVTETGHALTVAMEMAERLAILAPLALRAIKRLVDRGGDGALRDGLALEESEAVGLIASEDAAEGVRAFLEKRPPVFRGR